MLTRLAIATLVIGLGGCGTMLPQSSATEVELCRSWGESLPSRSRSDTDQTKAEIQISYADFQNACPAFAHLLPGSAAVPE